MTGTVWPERKHCTLARAPAESTHDAPNAPGAPSRRFGKVRLYFDVRYFFFFFFFMDFIPCLSWPPRSLAQTHNVYCIFFLPSSLSCTSIHHAFFSLVERGAPTRLAGQSR